MIKTYLPLTDQLYDYIIDNSLREPEILQQLRVETKKLTESFMQTSPDQAQFMAMLIKMMNANNLLEVGTFTGYSALSMVLNGNEKTKLITCDINEKWTDTAKIFWQKAGVSERIDLRLAPALQTLQNLLQQHKNQFDFAFIDADKTNYDQYFEACYQLVRPGGLIAIDNVFWSGAVADMEKNDADTLAIRALNKKLHNDTRIDISMISIADGLTLAYKR